jgi:hypothetical protein
MVRRKTRGLWWGEEDREVIPSSLTEMRSTNVTKKHFIWNSSEKKVMLHDTFVIIYGGIFVIYKIQMCHGASFF